MKVAAGWTLRCIDCGSVFESDPPGYTCSRCNGLLEAVREGGSLSRAEVFGKPGQGIWRFRVLLPFGADARPVSLGRGRHPSHKDRETSRRNSRLGTCT